MKITRRQLRNLLAEALEIGDRFVPGQFTDWLSKVNVKLPFDKETISAVNDMISTDDPERIEQAIFLMSSMSDDFNEEKARQLVDGYLAAKNPEGPNDIGDRIPTPLDSDYLSGNPLSLPYESGDYMSDTYNAIEEILRDEQVKSYITRNSVKIHRAIASDKLVLYTLTLASRPDYELRIYGQNRRPAQAEIGSSSRAKLSNLSSFVSQNSNLFKTKLTGNISRDAKSILNQLQNLRIISSLTGRRSIDNFIRNPGKYLNKGDSIIRRLRPRLP